MSLPPFSVMDEIEDLEHGREAIKATNDGLMDSMRQRLGALPGNNGETQQCTIFRVPENIRIKKPHMFEPVAVSIGPYHQGKRHLNAMEERKWPLLREFLSRDNNITLDACIAEIRLLESQARKCYSETIDIDSDPFVMMMILDGSFILQYIFDYGPETKARYFDAGWVASMVSNDLILIENQIPFFILQRLYYCLRGRDIAQESIPKFANFLIRSLASSNIPANPTEIHHLLHLCHHYVVPANMVDDESATKPQKTDHPGHIWPHWISLGAKKLLQRKICLNSPKVPEPEHSGSIWTIPCATELHEAGVKIKKKKPPCDFTDVTFQSGVLEIPFLHISDGTTIIVMNLIALEQCRSLNLPRLISTYIAFMDKIINTTSDVIILQRRGIIGSMLSGEEEVALFFNQSGQKVFIYKKHYLAGLFQEVNKYCETRKHRYRAKLVRDYFSSPWSMLSLFAAIFLLLLTCTQTFYAVFAYHRPP